ncbi:MAG TPA: hypothetical protein PLD47_12895 [Aggregatilineales bacterium]|nr:hypothetical protein [Anaerolineales bacterium]HRE48615.1 hypothetical protein [Aggregatilineales bacterium]
MSQLDFLVQQAVAALKASKRQEARRILEHVVEQDERHEQAWLWLSGCVETIDEQIICLQNVLTVNPGNQKARKGIETLQAQKAAKNPPPKSPSATPTSMDWGGGGIPAAGSGKHVQQPTDAEYDDWLASLPIGSGSGGGNVFASDYSSTAGPFSAAPAAEPNDPYGGYQDYGATTSPTTSSTGSYDPYNYDSYDYSQSPTPSSDYSPYGAGTVETYDYSASTGYDESYQSGIGSNAPAGSSGYASPPPSAAPNPFDSFSMSGNFDSAAAPPPAAPYDAGYLSSYETPVQSYDSSGGYDSAGSYATYETEGYDQPAADPEPAYGIGNTNNFDFSGGLTMFDPDDLGDIAPSYDPVRAGIVSGGATITSGGNPSAAASLSATTDRRFAMIPEEITFGGGKTDIKTLGIVGVLALLNVISLLVLLSNVGS